MSAKKCRMCGCTDGDACKPRGCSWVTSRPPVCSACFVWLLNLRSEAIVQRVLGLFEMGVPRPETSTEAVALGRALTP